MQTFNRLELPAKFQTLSSNAVSMDVDAAPSTATCTTPPQPHFSSEAQLGAATQPAMETNSIPLKPMSSVEQTSLLSNICNSKNAHGRYVLDVRGDELRDNSMHSFGSPLQHVPDPHMTLTDSEPSPLNGDLHACASTIQLGPGSTLPTPQPFDLFAGGAGPRPTADSTPPFRCQHHTTPALMQTSRLQNLSLIHI